MSLDDRIRQLSEIIIEEVRSPIESALHVLLEDVMRIAGEDREQAIQSAAAAAAVEHEVSIATLRENLEREHDEKIAALRTELTSEHEAGTATLRDHLGRERNAAIASAREQFDEERDLALVTLRAELDQERDTAVARLRDDLVRESEAAVQAARDEAARGSEAAVQAARDEAVRGSEAAVQAARDEAARLHEAQLQEHEARSVAERESAVQAVREELGRAHDAALNAVRTAAEVAAGAALTAALAEAVHERHEAEARVAVLEQVLEQARADTALAQEASLAADRRDDLAGSGRTLTAFRQLDEARSLTDALRILADQAASEVGRVAVLLVIDSRLRGWEVRGLPGADAAAIDAPVVAGTVFGLAIARGLPASTSEAPLGPDGDPLADLLAAPPDRPGLAVPISVGGRVVAILYADDAGDRTPVAAGNWPEVAEILARHTGHCLEVLTISHASILAGRVQQEVAAPAIRPSDASPFADERREEDSARRYARLLISEIKLYNEAAVEQGRSERNLLGRLGPDIERARRLYEDKIPTAVRHRVNCFDQELLRTLAGGDPSLLGQT
jgi:hypothetical protein